jgi:serine/threonine-protein kinase
VGADGDQAFIAMECLEGGTLTQWLQAQPRPRRRILQVFLAAGEGLLAAHRAGLIHRDFKPDNVLMGTDGRPRVADFGLARATWSSDATTAGPLHTAPAGTPAYMAPEQFKGRVDARSDQFAFCVSLWQALAGVRPYEGFEGSGEGTRPRPRGEIPAELGAHVRQALERGSALSPDERFPSMAELLSELRRRPLAVRPFFRGALAAGAALALAGLFLRWRAAPAESPPSVASAPAAPVTEAPTPVPATHVAPPSELAPTPQRRPHGRLVVRVYPWATISVDGRKEGTTPLPPLAVAVGRHTVVAENASLKAKRVVTVDVREGRDAVVRLNLGQAP